MHSKIVRMLEDLISEIQNKIHKLMDLYPGQNRDQDKDLFPN